VLSAAFAEPPVDSKPSPAKVEKKPAFLRVQRDTKKQPVAMQTAIVRYTKPSDSNGPVVDLIGAVHVGDRAYYSALNKAFEQYDALLYELVAPPNARPKEGQASGHPVGTLQQSLKEILDLDYQLDRVDYHKKNFVHADMSPDDFSRSMDDRGESFWTLLFRMMGQGMAVQAKNPERSTDMQLLAALFSPNRPLALKRAMAEQFEDLEGSMGVFDGPNGSVIITERNKVALDVLRKELDAGKKKLGVFYGAGHLADMEKRLIADFGLQRASETWLTAWDMTEKPRQNAGPKK
jgi:hypothetical protein